MPLLKTWNSELLKEHCLRFRSNIWQPSGNLTATISHAAGVSICEKEEVQGATGVLF